MVTYILVTNVTLPKPKIYTALKYSELGYIAYFQILTYQFGRSRFRFPMVSLEFVIDIILPAVLCGPGVDSASNRNEYQEYFLEVKGGRYVRLTPLTPSCADCLDIWEPQPPGTLRACPGLSRPVMGLLYLFYYLLALFTLRKPKGSSSLRGLVHGLLVI
jgi:hypothetical protein